jgi:uncharacterized protein
MYFYGFDPFIVPILIIFVLSLWGQSFVSSRFKKYSKVATDFGAADMAKIIANVPVELSRSAGLSDHYDPRTRAIYLSEQVYSSSSAAAVGIAAHEAGHAVQDQQGYLALRLRNGLFPIANLGSNLAIPLFFLGFLFSMQPLVEIGIIFFFFALLFSIITLPVEFDASIRAVRQLQGYLSPVQLTAVKKVLTAAALTYVLSTIMALLQFLRLLFLSRRN